MLGFFYVWWIAGFIGTLLYTLHKYQEKETVTIGSLFAYLVMGVPFGFATLIVGVGIQVANFLDRHPKILEFVTKIGKIRIFKGKDDPR